MYYFTKANKLLANKLSPNSVPLLNDMGANRHNHRCSIRRNWWRRQLHLFTAVWWNDDNVCRTLCWQWSNIELSTNDHVFRRWKKIVSYLHITWISYFCIRKFTGHKKTFKWTFSVYGGIVAIELHMKVLWPNRFLPPSRNMSATSYLFRRVSVLVKL